ncbi:hypothetical protein ACLMJK_001203 [Lecanora helva]
MSAHRTMPSPVSKSFRTKAKSPYHLGTFHHLHQRPTPIGLTVMEHKQVNGGLLPKKASSQQPSEPLSQFYRSSMSTSPGGSMTYTPATWGAHGFGVVQQLGANGPYEVTLPQTVLVGHHPYHQVLLATYVSTSGKFAIAYIFLFDLVERISRIEKYMEQRCGRPWSHTHHARNLRR